LRLRAVLVGPVSV